MSRDVLSAVRLGANRTAVLRGARCVVLLDDNDNNAIAAWQSDAPISALFALDAPSAPRSLVATWSGASRRVALLSSSLREIASLRVPFDDDDVVDDSDDDDELLSATLVRAHAASATLGVLRARAGQFTVVRVDFTANAFHVASHALQFVGAVLDWHWFDGDDPWTIAVVSGSLAAPHFDMCRISLRRDNALSLVAANVPQPLPRRAALVVPLARELAVCGLGAILLLSLQRQPASTALVLAHRTVSLAALDGAIVALCAAGTNSQHACFLVTRRGTLYHVDWQRGVDRVSCAVVARVVDAGVVQTLLHCGGAAQQRLLTVSTLGVLSFVTVTVGASALSAAIESLPAPRLRRALALECAGESDDALLVATPDGLSALMRGVAARPESTPIVQFTVDESAAPVRAAAFAVSMAASLVAESDSIIILSLPLPARRTPTSALSLSSSASSFAKKGKRKSRADNDDGSDLDSDDSQAPVDDFDVPDDAVVRAPSARKRTVTKRFREALGVAAETPTTAVDGAGDDALANDFGDEPEAALAADDDFNEDDAVAATSAQPPRKRQPSSKKKATDASSAPAPGQDGVTRLFEMSPSGKWDERPLRELGKRATLCAGRLVGSFVALVSANDVRIVEMASYALFFKWSSSARIVSADVSLTDIVVLEETGDVRLLRMTPITMKMADVRTIMSWQVTNLPHAVTEASLVALAPAHVACTCHAATMSDERAPCNAHDNADVVYGAYRAQLSPLIVAASVDSLRLFHVDKGVSDVFELPLRDASDESVVDAPTSVVCASRRGTGDSSRVLEVLIAFASGCIRSFRLAEEDGGVWSAVAQHRTLISSGALVLQRSRSSVERVDGWTAFVFGASAGPVVCVQVGRDVTMRVTAVHGVTATNGRCLWQARHDALVCVGATTASIVTLPALTGAAQSFEAISWHGTDAGTAEQRLPISHLLAVSPTSRLVVLQSNRTAPVLRFADPFGVWSAQATNVPFVASDAVVGAVVDARRALVVLATRNDASGASSLRLVRANGEQLAEVAIKARVCSLALLDGVGVVVGADRSVRVYEWTSGASSLSAVTSLDIAGAAVSVAALAAARGAIAAWDDAAGPILLQYKDRTLQLRASCKRSERCRNRGGVVAIGEVRGGGAVRIVSGDETQWVRIFRCEWGEKAASEELVASDAMILAALTQLASRATTTARRQEELECVSMVRVDGSVRSVRMQANGDALAVDASGQAWRIEAER